MRYVELYIGSCHPTFHFPCSFLRLVAYSWACKVPVVAITPTFWTDGFSLLIKRATDFIIWSQGMAKSGCICPWKAWAVLQVTIRKSAPIRCRSWLYSRSHVVQFGVSPCKLWVRSGVAAALISNQTGCYWSLLAPWATLLSSSRCSNSICAKGPNPPRIPGRAHWFEDNKTEEWRIKKVRVL